MALSVSVQLAVVIGIASALAPLALLWLRTAGHERRIEREVIACARQLSAHLAAGENLYRSIRQLSGSRDNRVERAFGKVADEFRFDRPLGTSLARRPFAPITDRWRCCWR